jgi:beta-glucanase (GH16 family)
MRKIILLLILSNVALAQQTKRKLVWEDNFDGNKLDEKNWNFETGGGGFGNHERETYTKDNQKVADGKLTITVKKDGDTYTSSRLTTKDKHQFKYGRIEARAKLPVGSGIWPAFWMLGANISQVGWPKSGEIDIMEYIGREPHTIFTTLHTTANHGADASSKKVEVKNIEDGFHVYAAEWDKDKINFFVDDQLVHTFEPQNKTPENWPFDQPFFIILNVAVGGDFGGPGVDDTIFPQEYVVDYVRVYE